MRRSPASQYPKRAAKTGSMVKITAVRAAGMRCWTKVCTQNAPADATRPVATRASQTSRGGKATGSKKGQKTPKTSATESLWAKASSDASYPAA